MTKEEFILRAKKIHGDKYDYSKIVYVNGKTKVCIICPKHGEFWQEASSHLRGYGCRKCADDARKIKETLSTEEFIKRAKEIHGNKYDYSKTVYNGYNNPLLIICPRHGEFLQVAGTHLKGSGCKKCGDESESLKKKKITREILIERFKKVHGDLYDYSNVNFINWTTKVEIFCKKHQETFFMTPFNHLNGQGCKKCKTEKISNSLRKKTFNDFLEEAVKIHGNKYDYSLAEKDYCGVTKKVRIICHKKDSKKVEHGVFFQRVCDHINGKTGCPKCNESKLEKEISSFLIENNIAFQYQKTFSWLKYKKNMFLDFYLPKQKIAIECQGEQHFNSVEYYGGIRNFILTTERDKTKKELCEKHGIKILYYSKVKEDSLINDKNILLQKIND